MGRDGRERSDGSGRVGTCGCELCMGWGKGEGEENPREKTQGRREGRSEGGREGKRERGCPYTLGVCETRKDAVPVSGLLPPRRVTNDSTHGVDMVKGQTTHPAGRKDRVGCRPWTDSGSDRGSVGVPSDSVGTSFEVPTARTHTCVGSDTLYPWIYDEVSRQFDKDTFPYTASLLLSY